MQNKRTDIIVNHDILICLQLGISEGLNVLESDVLADYTKTKKIKDFLAEKLVQNLELPIHHFNKRNSLKQSTAFYQISST